jgi:hypothetical protein
MSVEYKFDIISIIGNSLYKIIIKQSKWIILIECEFNLEKVVEKMEFLI